jgi:glycosyltransferase domain-containing protein
MRGRLTIIIPTHNRHHYLSRCVRWFSNTGCNIIIADSTETPWVNELKDLPQVTYLHHPGGFEVYIAKMVAAYDHVVTPYAMMCADDDFTIHAAMKQSVDFLDESPSFHVCCGYHYLFQSFGPRVILWPMDYKTHDLTHEDWKERLPSATSTPYYAVVRTESMRDAFTFLLGQDFTGIESAFVGFVDTALTLMVARRGKFKRLPTPFAFREYSPVVSAQGLRPRTITSPVVARFYSALIDRLIDGDQDAREMMLRLAARDYAGQLTYDLSLQPSRKRQVESLPPWLQLKAEEAFRFIVAARLYAKPQFRQFLAVFRHPERKRLKEFLPNGTQS